MRKFTIKEVLTLEKENLGDSLLLESGVRIPAGTMKARILFH